MLIGAKIDKELKGDRYIWFILVLLSLLSLLAVYSSTGTLAFLEKNGHTELYLIKHALILTMGIALAYVFHLFHYMRFAKFAPFLYMAAVPLLIYTLLFGVEINFARRWVELPILGITFQSSDFAKLALIIYLARTISMKQDVIKDLKLGFLPLIVPVVVICLLIAPANLSTAAILFFTCFVMMFIGRVSVKHLLALGVAGIMGLGALVMVGEHMPDKVRVKTWSARISNFLAADGEKKDDYQVEMAKVAIANGGLIGVGPGNSFQRNYLPYPYADFIFAIIFEEYGLIGGAGVIFLYMYLFYRCVKLVTRSPRAFGAILAMGLSLLLMVQAFVNMAVSVNLLPVTGVNLPLISMGGSSVFFIGITIGIIISVSKYIETPGTPDETKGSIANEQSS